MHKTCSIKKICFILIGLTISIQCEAQITAGTWRNEYIRGATDACYRDQRASADNNGVSNTNLKKYCACSWDYLANLMSNDMARKGQAPNPKWVQMAAEYCQKNFTKY